MDRNLYSIGQSFGEGGPPVKKLPIIGLVIGAIAAFFAMRKKKSGEQPTEDSGSASSGAPPTT
jgi:hypothetical protein